MIGTPPNDRIKNRDTDVSFFEALAQVVEASGLSHLEISRNANKRLREIIAKIPDTSERILLEVATQWLNRSTIYRAVTGKSSVSEDTLSLIVSGLVDLDEETIQWLKALREEEDHVHHSTQQRAIVTKTNEDPQTDELPRWITEF